MLAHACNFTPSLTELKVLRSWTGLRAASPDGCPIIGVHPFRSSVWIATGHEGLGITTALATAELLAQQLCGQATTLDPVAFSPSRFIKD